MTAPPTRDSATEICVERLVELLNSDGRMETTARSLHDLFDDPRCIVLLGDPGMGKTTALRQAATALPGSIYRRVRSFAPGTMTCIPPGGTLLLDALDEAMAAGANDPLAVVAARLHDLGRPRFWLSCRAVDWVGQGGTAELQDCASSGLVVARLLPLDDGQIAELAQSKGLNGADLLNAMREANLVPLLRNPWTLSLVFEVAADGLPRSRHDLFERAAELLTRERRDRPRSGQIVATEVLDAAGAIFAALLISGVNAITTGVRSITAASIAEFGPIASSRAVDAALRTRLFASAGEESWEPQHRTLAEFLGARFLADRIANHGLSLRRVLALLRGAAPTPHHSLRGLFAWLATLLPPDRAASLAAIDPYGVLSYGDPARMAPAVRQVLLVALGELAEREPWFRMQGWSEARFGALVIPELIPELREMLAERPARPHLLSCVCDALAEGEPRPDLAADLATLLTDPQVAVQVRVFALKAYLRASSATPEVTCAFFRRLLSEPALDPQAQLASHLFFFLYPERLGTNDLVAFLDRWVEGNGNDGPQVLYRLPRIVPAGAEPELLDTLATRPWTTRQDVPPGDRVHEGQEIIGLLAARAIQALSVADASRIAAWFKLLAAYPVRKKEEFRAALAARGDLLPSLVIMTSEDLGPVEVVQAPWAVLSRLEQTLLQWRWPPDAAARLLGAAQSETIPTRAARLFAAALDAYMNSAKPDIGWFEEAWSFGHSRYDLTLILTVVCAAKPIMPEMQGFKEQGRQACATRDAYVAQRTRELEQRQAGIMAGTEVGCLSWLGACWFNLVLVHVDLDTLSPSERLRALVPEAVAAAAEQGFRRLTLSGHVPTSAELAKQAIKNSWPQSNYPILAGADLLFADAGPELPMLPTDRLTSLLCLALARTTSKSAGDVDHQNGRPWIDRIVSAMPGESAQALRALIEPQLIAGSDYVTGLNAVCHDEMLAPVRPILIPDLLQLARRPNSFWQLAATVLRVLPSEEVHRIALDRLSQMLDTPLAERWPWLHLAWRLQPAQHENSICFILASNHELHIELAEATGDTLAGDSPMPTPLTFAHRALILRVFGPVYPPISMPGGVMGISPGYQLGRAVQAQIDRLSTMPDEAAGSLLSEVAADPAYAAHRDHALQSLAAWQRDAYARAWKPSTIGAVLVALQSGAPASAADLTAFAEEHLVDLSVTLRRTEDNEWRGFWNTDAYGHVNAKVENFCRDQLVILLRGRFERAGLGLATEVRHAGEDRCDIVARALDRTLPIEIKCDYHDKLWTAWRDQLAESYAREPRAAGMGVYLVFWFGPERGSGRYVKSAPDGSRPENAAELERKLSAMIEESGLPIRILVLDVMPSKPRRDTTARGTRKQVAARSTKVLRARLP